MEFKGMDELMEAYQIKKNEKPWYWPVTTTIYKMFLAFILTAGVYHIVGFYWPAHELIRGGLSGMIAFLIFLSLWKRDWL